MGTDRTNASKPQRPASNAPARSALSPSPSARDWNRSEQSEGWASTGQESAGAPWLAPRQFDFASIPIHSGEAEQGRPLEDGLRRPMEHFFQRPLAEVRIFSGPSSHRAVESLGAYALTQGQDIHLGDRGRSLPAPQQRGLFAHEVAHTIQQRSATPASPHGALKPDAADTQAERQADALSRAFLAHERGHPGGLAMRDRVGLDPVSSIRPHLARIPTNFGDFEDAKFNKLTADAGSSVPTGTELGVQIRLKFNPGSNVDATKIGLTQAADTVIGGQRHADDVIARHSATTGPGAGFHIDVPSKRPSPMYAASGTPTGTSDPTKLGSYDAPGIGAMPRGGNLIGGNVVKGIDYGGGSIYGYRYTTGGTPHGPVPAELHDAPQDPTATPSSKQVLETAALAMEGAMAGTYLGSVEWGWERDGTGNFVANPIKLKSPGVPSANFRTAANIWNASKDDVELVVSATTADILSETDASIIIRTVPRGTRLRFLASGAVNGTKFDQVETIAPPAAKGIVDATQVKQQDTGRDTVKLPEPDVSTVNAASKLSAETGPSAGDPTVSAGTRVRVIGAHPTIANSVRVEVIDGALAGRTGVMLQSSLTKEALGTR
jgi:hypothetical protein